MHKINATFETIGNKVHIEGDKNLLIVGKLRRNYDNDKVDLRLVRTGKRPRNCDQVWNQEELKRYSIYFERCKNREIRLAFMFCTGVGTNKYLTQISDLTIPDLASSKNVSGLVETEYAKLRKNPLFRSMCSTFANNPIKFGEMARELIHQKTGEWIDIRKKTPTLQSKIHQCEYCHSTALELNRAGISREQFHEYVSERTVKKAVGMFFSKLRSIGKKK